MKKIIILLIIVALKETIFYAQKREDTKYWQYPAIEPDTAIDYYFGKKVVDPYRNLENIENEKVKSWLIGQNKLYDTIIHYITDRDLLVKEIETMQKKRQKWAMYPKMAGSRFFYPSGYFDDHDIERMVYTDSLHKEPIELYNTKTINNKDSCVYNFNYYEPSFDGRYIAFGISPNGSEKAKIYIVDVEKKELLLSDTIRSQAGNIQWVPDGTGFFYVQEKEIITEEDKNTPYEDAKVRFHKLYTDARNDRTIFSRLLNKESGIRKDEWPMLYIFPSSDKVLINFSNELYNVIYYTNLNDVLNKPVESIIWKKICGVDEKITCNVLHGDKFLGLSFKNNPNGQLIAMTLPDITPKVVFDASDFALDDMVITKKSVYVTSIEKGLNKLLRINPENYKIEIIELPFRGGLRLKPSFSAISYYQPSNYLCFTLTGYDKQWGAYICDEKKHVIRTDIFPEVQYTDTPFELIVEETEAPSHDGTLVPLSIIYKKGMKFDGTNPAMIEAYGAFGLSMKPEFSRNRLAWFNHGGIYAVAHVRGGGEKGDKWYKGGFKITKPNSWKDLIACAEFLIKNKYTSSQKLAITGYSAGGITIGRAITERPDLFKAAVIFAGTLNPVRMENSFNNSTVSEFGTVKDSLEFQYLYNMDTYLHIREDVTYPSVLFTAGLNDARVAPWQPGKAVAKMQKLSIGNNIVLFRVADTGHFDYPSDADVYSFLFWQLGHPDFKLKLPLEKN